MLATRHARGYHGGVRLSVVIPTYGEAETIADAVRCARTLADEVIVVDADSPDGTSEAARRAGAHVLVSGKGRGRQLAEGARAAHGDVLLFLHADARIRGPGRRAIEQALESSRVCGGNFQLRFVPATRWARFFSWANDARRRVFRIYYGDSAIFVRRATYDALGGFTDQPLLEDYDFARRIERHGQTVYLREAHVEVSARRFASKPGHALLSWVLVQSLYSLGVPAHKLVAFYPDVR